MNKEHYKAIINLQQVQITTLETVLRRLLSESKKCASAEVVQLAEDALGVEVDWVGILPADEADPGRGL